MPEVNLVIRDFVIVVITDVWGQSEIDVVVDNVLNRVGAILKL